MLDVTDDTSTRTSSAPAGRSSSTSGRRGAGRATRSSRCWSELENQDGGRVGFAKLNVDQNPLSAVRYEVLALPTAILFANGEAQETVVGARSPSHYERAWATWLAE